MRYIDLTISDYLDALASKQPTPGGGTASAIALCQSASLVAMVANLTIGNDKYQDGWPASKTALSLSISARESAGQLAEQDSAAFDQVMSAFRMAKTTEEEKIQRRKMIRQATLVAAQVPYETALLAIELLESMKHLSHNCNGNAVSDIGVAALLATAGCKGALFNVEINLNSLPSDVGVTLRNGIADINDQCRALSKEIMHNVKSRL